MGDFIKIKHGYAFSGEHITSIETDKILVTPGNFHIGGGFKSDKFKYYNSNDFPQEYMLHGGDIIVTMTDLSKDTDTLGYSAKVPNNISKLYLHNQRIGLLQFRSDKVYPDFVYWLMRTKEYQSYIVGSASGTSIMHTSPSRIEAYSFLFPPIDEQKRIAGVLSSLDDKIDLLNRENATLEALAETLFRHYFIENPDPTWKEGNIADVVDFNPARKLGKGEKAPYVEMANIGTNGYAPSSWRIRSFVSGTKFINGDTLMARISPCLENGKAAFVDFLEKEQVGWGSTEFIVMRSKLGIHQFFAYVLSRYDDFRDHAVSSLVGSSGRQRVDLDNLIKYPFIIPGKQAIELFNHELNTIFPKMQNNQKQILTLTAQRDTLLSRLMNGEVNVVE